jgi:hypothetical protein
VPPSSDAEVVLFPQDIVNAIGDLGSVTLVRITNWGTRDSGANSTVPSAVERRLGARAGAYKGYEEAVDDHKPPGPTEPSGEPEPNPQAAGLTSVPAEKPPEGGGGTPNP